MRSFFDEHFLLSNNTAIKLYQGVKTLPIIDYHCHLEEKEIADNKKFSDIGELWLACDHYKWRAMRLCGVDEKYITGTASYKEKFFKYAGVMPLLAGNPLYYFSHLELKIVFGINKPLNEDTVADIWNAANEKLKDLSVLKLLKLFNVEYIATTDAPGSDLKHHGKYGDTLVCPTFRPDKVFEPDGCNKQEMISQLDYFTAKGCKISDHSLDFELTGGHMDTLEFLAGEYKKRDI